MDNVLINIIPNVILAISFTAVGCNLKFIEMGLKDIILFGVINFLIYYFSSLTSSILGVPLSITFVFIFVLIKNKSIYSSLIPVGLTYIIMAVSDVASGFIFMVLFKFSYTMIKGYYPIYIALHILIFILSFSISRVLGNVLDKMKLQNYYIKEYLKNNLIVIIYVTISLLFVYINAMIYKYLFYETNKLVITLYTILFTIYFLASFIVVYSSTKSIKKQIKYEYEIKEMEQLKEYTDMIENISNDLRKFRHDYINILSTLNGYIETKDIDGLKKYFDEEIVSESSKVSDSNKNLSILKHVKIVGLKGLISSKIINAQSKNINVYIDIIEDIDEVSVDVIDICRIIGILFDNAIEAAAICDIKIINFGIIKENNYITFIISNSYCFDIPSVYKIYEEGFSTKGRNRGLGLNIVRSIVDEKYDNMLLNTVVENNIFKQELIIHNNKKGKF